ncbi:NACHT domain-containing protein [Streptomyces luteogriseus]|uniref:NACHT domain-containing protein n=1 Tax=Streptomyces luteogriseus TaxID=68233 RepID=UPI0037B21157
MNEEPGRRFLLAAATPRYPRQPDWDRPELAGACEQVVSLFTQRFGYELADDPMMDPTAAELASRLRAFCRRADLTPEDMLVVYIGTHGEVLSSGEHVLLTSDTDPDDLDDALSTGGLTKKVVQGTNIRRVLLLVDTCYSEQGGSELVAQAVVRTATAWARDLGSAFGVITSAKPAQEAAVGAFPALLSAALDDLDASGYEGPAYQPDAVVDAMNRSPLRPGHQVISTNWVGLTGLVPPFFPAPDRPVILAADVLPPAAFRTVAEGYLRWAANAWRYIELGDLGAEAGEQDQRRVRRLPMRSMYISLQADARTADDRARSEELRLLDASENVRGSWGSRLIEILRQGARQTSGSASADPDPVGLEEAFERDRVVVVLGDPGTGKTVLCQWLGSQLALEGRDVLLGRTAGVLRIPLRFRAADYAAHNAPLFAAGDDAEDLPAFLAASLPDDALTAIGYGAATLRAMFTTALVDGSAVMLVDGLDELVRYRDEVVRSMDGLVRKHVLATDGPAKALITSRVAGYDEVHLAIDGIAHYLIRPLTESQIETFVTQFFTEIRAVDEIAPFTTQLQSGSPTVRRLARTPLLLTSMCSYWYRHRALPATRAGLYRQLLLDTAYRWRRFPGITDPGLNGVVTDEDAFLSMLSRVALWMLDNGDIRIREDKLVEFLDEALFGASRLTGDGTGAVALRLVDHIREKVGVLAEFSPGEFGFAHPTFREYLVGLSLLDGEVPLPDRIAEVIDDPSWREPILLVLGESTPELRDAVIVRGADAEDPEPWLRVFLTAQLEAPPGQQYLREVSELLKLAAQTYEVLRAAGEPYDRLDDAVAEVRAHVGSGFDGVAMAALESPGALGPLTALYLRREWLDGFVTSCLLLHVDEDPPEWGHPVQRALGRAGGPAPARKVSILDELYVPEDDENDQWRQTRRTVELGRAAWERERRRVDQAEVEPFVLPLPQLLTAEAGLWARCRLDPAVTRVLVTLFGGLDHQDVLRWTSEYHDFARLLSEPDAKRAAEIHGRASELVPRFKADDLVYNIAVYLDTTGKPAPVAVALDPAWMTRPCTPDITAAVREWLLTTPGQAETLRAALREVTTDDGTAIARAEAELGLLALDGTATSGKPATTRALARAVESVADAVVRACLVLHDQVWSAENLNDPTRTAGHLALLRMLHSLGAWPHVLTLRTPDMGHPLKQATALAEFLTGRWQEEPPPPAPLDPTAVLAWLAVLPGQYGKPGLFRKSVLSRLRVVDPWQQHPLAAALAALPDDTEVGAGTAAEEAGQLIGTALVPVLDALAGTLPAEVRLALEAGAPLLDELRRIDPAALPGARFAPTQVHAVTLLDAEGTRDLLGAEPGAAEMALALVNRVTGDAAEVLAAGLEQTRLNPGWAPYARDVLALHDLENRPWDEDTGAALVDLVCTASAATATTAHLVLLGPLRGVERDDRPHRLSERGLDGWWGMATALRTEPRPLRRGLLRQALSQWDIDDPDAVRDALRRAAGEPHGHQTWLLALSAVPRWRQDAQRVLAQWAAEADDREGALAAHLAVALQLGAGHEVVPELVAAVADTAERVGVSPCYLPGAVGGTWAIELTTHVVQACTDALAAGLTGDSAAEEAIRRLEAAALPVGRTERELTSYGAMAYTPLGARPDMAAAFIPEDVDADAMTGLLLAWLPSLKSDWGEAPLIAIPTANAVLNLLVEMTAHDPYPPFLVRAEPARVQPLLSAQVLEGNDLAAMAALSLLAALRHVDLEPAEGPGLIDVMEDALLRGARVGEAALDCVRSLQRVRGGSLAGMLLDRIAATRNESVAQGLAGLAAASAQSPSCPSADQRRIRLSLSKSLAEQGWCHGVRLEGSGSADDPVVQVVGPDRRTAVRRLLRRGD